MRFVFSLAILISANAAYAADAPAPMTNGVTFKCTGTEERQVRDLVADASGRLKKGDFLPAEKRPESFEHVFKPTPLRVTTKDGRSVTTTETCEVAGEVYTCITKHGESPMPYVMTFNLSTGAYSATNDDELVKSRRSGTCDMTAAKALMEQAKNTGSK